MCFACLDDVGSTPPGIDLGLLWGPKSGLSTAHHSVDIVDFAEIEFNWLPNQPSPPAQTMRTRLFSEPKTELLANKEA